ncbi:MAG TPA: LysM domain-containing protein [Dehalococcoidia bacterium]|nr:LysM domain-containing protein [Dehalococcoidia bacterium]
MDCYACDQESTQRCLRCGNHYCREHGDDPSTGSGQALCADCLDPVSAVPSSAVFRASLLGLLVASVLALWLLVRPPSLPGESSEVNQAPLPVASPESAVPTPPPGGPTPTPAAATPALTPTPTPAGPIQYTVVENDTWYGIAGAFGVDAEALAAANGRTLEDFLQPGEVLLIPQ